MLLHVAHPETHAYCGPPFALYRLPFACRLPYVPARKPATLHRGPFANSWTRRRRTALAGLARNSRAWRQPRPPCLADLVERVRAEDIEDDGGSRLCGAMGRGRGGGAVGVMRFEESAGRVGLARALP